MSLLPCIVFQHRQGVNLLGVGAGGELLFSNYSILSAYMHVVLVYLDVRDDAPDLNPTKE